MEKLYTATTALERMGPTAHLSTTVYGTGKLAPGGVWEGDLYLRGGGDPTFGSSAFIRSHYDGVGASVSTLVSQLVHTDGIHRITGSIYGDESFLDSLRGEPSSDYAPDPFLEGTLSGLAFNRGESGSTPLLAPHAPAAYAAHELLAGLKSDGVSIAGHSAAATTPAGASQLAQVASPTVTQLLGLMLPPSDNFFAETLVKDLGALYGGSGTTSAGAAIVRATIGSLLGVHPDVVDGSGLSEADKTSPYEVADLLWSSPRPRSARCCATAWLWPARPARSPNGCATPARPAAVRARPARSPASPTSSATATRPMGTRSCSRSSPTGSESRQHMSSRTT